jgi:8-oxo-dGTP pyrophosphatase MutT (NUDIX family)
MLPTDRDAAADWIRHCLQQGPQPGWQEQLPERHAFSEVREAAVLIPLVWRPDGPTILLTRRSDALSAHPGQVSFPGGKQDAVDTSAQATALREAEEEIGLQASVVSVLGVLPRVVTASRFSVVPVVGLIDPQPELMPHPGEVAEIFEVPLSRVMQPEHYLQHVIERNGVAGRYLSLTYRRYFIWGATAAMLRLLSLTLRPPG